MTLKLILRVSAIAAAATLLAGGAQAVSPAVHGSAPADSAADTPINAADFTKYARPNDLAAGPIEMPAAQPRHFEYVRNLASGRLPEPGAWALMLIGFGGAGALIRRNRRMARAANI